MNPIKNYQFSQKGHELIGFSRGFSLAVAIILLFAALIIGGLIMNFRTTANAANAQLVYMAARAKAIEFQASGNYHVPIQADLIELIGEDVNQEAIIKVVDENRDAVIDYIVYTKNGLVTRYSPAELAAEK